MLIYRSVAWENKESIQKPSGIGPVEDSIQLRRQMIDTCLWLVEKGLVVSAWDNISVRLNDGNILITPSRIA